MQIWWGEATDEPALARQSVTTTAREDRSLPGFDPTGARPTSGGQGTPMNRERADRPTWRVGNLKFQVHGAFVKDCDWKKYSH